MANRQRTRIKHEHFLLGLLYQQPSHGYDLHKTIRQSPGLSAVWFVKPGRIYALLERLEKAGMLTATQVHSDKAPSRKVYHLTGEGERTFLDWVRQPVKHGRNMRLIFPARLYFALRLGKETALDLIETQRRECQLWLEDIHAKTDLDSQSEFFYKQISLYRTGQIEAMLNWLKTCEQEISSTL